MDIVKHITHETWMNLPCALERSGSHARFKCEPEDFTVEEVLPFTPTGEGEHIYLFIEKKGQNTAWVASELSRCAMIPPKNVSFAGLKDRQGITTQWFSAHLPGKLSAQQFASRLSDIPGIRIITAVRHSRKLQRGALKGNHFFIRLKDFRGNRNEIEERLKMISQQGVPNYYGYQRFGTNGNNIATALEFFKQRKKISRNKRSILLSSARSFLFNTLLAERVTNHTWKTLLAGDVVTFPDSQTIIFPEKQDQAIRERFAKGELLVTAPLWGKGDLQSSDGVREFEMQLLSVYPEMCQGLESWGMKQERRATQLPVNSLKSFWEKNHLCLSFFLSKGGYATAVLKEILTFSDDSLNQAGIS